MMNRASCWVSHVVLFVFVLRGAGLLGGAGRRCCCRRRHLRLLGGLLHLEPLLLGELCLLLPSLHRQHTHTHTNLDGAI